MTAPETTILYGDAWDLAGTLEPQSIDCIVTSPPYWGLRDYGHVDQFGLEPTPQEYVTKLVDLFDRLRPALKDCGTIFLNVGDSYFGDSPARKTSGEAFSASWNPADSAGNGGKRRSAARIGSLKPKDLCGIPWRVAFALQDAGWYLRSDIIWSKPNPMPESVTDRPTKSHEYLFLLSKQDRYYFDQEAVRERSVCEVGTAGSWNGNRDVSLPGGDTRFRSPNLGGSINGARNIRTVWTIATQPYPEAHFATFPPKLIVPCIKAGTSERGVCPDCGKPWERDTERETTESAREARGKALTSPRHDGNAWNENNGRGFTPTITRCSGWRPTCTHDCEPIPATVLDPFVGSGTTAEVARSLGRDSVGFELNDDYRPMIERRLQQGVLV